MRNKNKDAITPAYKQPCQHDWLFVRDLQLHRCEKKHDKAESERVVFACANYECGRRYVCAKCDEAKEVF